MSEKAMSGRKIKTKAQYIAALSYLVGKDELRFYLQGVYVEPSERGGIILVAANGHIMGIIHDHEGEANGQYICPVPKDTAKACKASNKKREKDRAETVFFRGDVAAVVNPGYDGSDPSRVSQNHLSLEFAPPINGAYPDWRVAAIAKEHIGPATMPVPVNGNYLAEWLAVGRALGDNRPAVYMFPHTDKEPVHIFFSEHPEFVGLQMPLVADMCSITEFPSIPDWALAKAKGKDND